MSTGLGHLPESLKNLWIYADGDYVRGHVPVVSVWDHGFLYGDGFFEGIRLYDGRVVELDAHVERFYQSAQFLRIPVPIRPEELRSIIIDVVRRNQLRNAHIRPMLTRGTGLPALNQWAECQPHLFVLAYPHPAPTYRPIRCLVSTVRRKAPLSIDARVKSLNYLDSVLAKVQAQAAGYDDAIMLDDRGLVAEGTGANLFLVVRGQLATPTLEAALDGITRRLILRLAREMGLAVREGVVTVGDLYLADEAFLAGTGADITPIGEVDGRIIGSGDLGPITRSLIEAYNVEKRTGIRLDVDVASDAPPEGRHE